MCQVKASRVLCHSSITRRASLLLFRSEYEVSVGQSFYVNIFLIGGGSGHSGQLRIKKSVFLDFIAEIFC